MVIKIEKELVEKAKKFVKENKIKDTMDALKDVVIHNFPENLIKEAFERGIYFTSDELYEKGENKFLEHKGKNYVVHQYKSNDVLSYVILKLVKYILVSFVLKEDFILIIHVGEPTRNEIKKFKEKQIKLKNSPA